MSVESALQALRLDLRFVRNITAWRHVPARPAAYAAFPAGLDDRLIAALAARGIEQLYTHQAETIAAALAGAHVAVVTPAASGKTLCYNLPVLHRLLADPAARALYLFPTKALAQDQLAELYGLLGEETRQRIGTDKRIDSRDPQSIRLSAAIRCPAATYDGDTPSSQRAKVRDAGRIILSNPDMLHAGILPQHTRWAAFFANLRVVVIDEMHVYRGVFGSHVANVLRRLRRICRFYGSDPQFILASATIANPADLAGRLVEAPVTVIGEERNGAPQGEREIIFYNPPLLDSALGIRRSSSLETADLAAHFLAHDVQTIVFARARLTTELILTYLRLRIADLRLRNDGLQSPISNLQTIRGYRGGYLPSERREIERGLREGAVRGVVATNALELGIDIGALGAAVLAGYPGTIASTRQQMGRAGRRQGVSVAVLVATATALDQYIVAHPDYVLARTPEHARLNADNEIILAGHLLCAAAELPLEAGTALTRQDRLLDDLVAAGQLYRTGDRYYWAGQGAPSAAVGLRTGSPDRVVIQMTDAGGKPQIIGELDRFGVPRLLYEGAIYLHEGVTYLVERLDWDAGIAYVKPVEVDFYTRPSIGEEVEVLVVRGTTNDERRTTNDRQPLTVDPFQLPISNLQSPTSNFQPPASNLQPPTFNLQSSWGDVRVISQATGYRILRRSTNEVLGFGTVDLPEQVLETQACWLAFSEALIEGLKATGEWFSDPNDYGPNWPAQRNAVRARDGFRCQNCGAAEPDGRRQHDVHHRIPFRAFVADASLRPGLGPQEAWQIANRLENLVTLCQTCHRLAEVSVRIGSGLGGAAALLAAVAPLTLMCDPADLGVVVEPKAPGADLPTITIYERAPGGVGYAEQLYRSMPDLLAAAYDLVAACPCERGCPSCVGPVLEHEYALDTKALSMALLREVCGT